MFKYTNMKIKRGLNGWLKIVAGFTIISISMSFGSMFFGPGYNDVQPIGPFVNHNFPDVNLNHEPYEIAYSNIRFDWPITYTVIPNHNRVLIGQLDGKIYWMDDSQGTLNKNLLVDFTNEIGDAVLPNIEVWDGGLLGLEIHPEFGEVGKNFIFIYYTTESETGDDTLNSGGNGTFGCDLANFHGNYIHLDRFEINPSNMSFVANSRKRMMRRRMLNTTHRGGAMEFGDDGFLYIATGEQGRAVSAQNLSDNLDGGVLRIDVDMNSNKSHPPIRIMPDNAGETDEFSGRFYWIPNDNPFLSASGNNFEEYYTVGNRSPHRMSKDSQTGKLYIGEVGQSTHDEINVVSKGKNYGWPVWEGEIPGPFNQCNIQMLNNMEHEVPLTSFNRDDAKSIIGGQVYRGSEFISYKGKYITADWLTQKIFSVDITDGSHVVLGTLPKRPISFGEGKDGSIYYLLQGNNVQLLRFVAPVLSSGIPQLLSETGVFTNLGNLTVTNGFVPYDMIDAFWSDRAVKKRWMAIPNDGTHDSVEEQIQYSENNNWIFPVGSVLVKHFDYPISDSNPELTAKIETRISIKNSDNNWTFLSYKWNSSQTDAVLVDMTTGEERSIGVVKTDGGTRTEIWRYPSTNECLNCHNESSQGTLGPRTRYLNIEYDYSTHINGGMVANQLVTLSHLGILDEQIIDSDTQDFLTHTSIDDLNATLEDKARSYLDLNCAYCHLPSNGLRAEFDLRLINSLEETGLLTAGIGEVVEGIGNDQKILYPGNAAKSHIFYRVNSTDSGIMMPPIAKNKIDEKGVELLQEWINQLNVEPNTGKFNDPDANINLGLLDDAVLSGTVGDGRGTMEAILYDPIADNYYTPTRFNEHGVAYQENLGRPVADDGFRWQVDWPTPKRINYITFGGTYPNQPQPNSMWRISYLHNGSWAVLEEGKGGWIDSGIYEWGGSTQYPIVADALRVQVYSDGNNDLVSIHLRGRGGVSQYVDDSAMATKATLIQYLPGDPAPDTTAPVITLFGPNPQVIELGVGYTELGATTDDGSSVTIDTGAFVDAIGSYDIVYSSSDGINASEEVVRRVDVVEPVTESFNDPDANINLGLLDDAVLSGTVGDGRGTMEAILYDPIADNYYTPTRFNEHGVAYQENLGRPVADDGFRWQVDWPTPKRINYITFGGTYPNQPQPNSMWRISYLHNGSWAVLEEGKGGWIDSGIYEWGGSTQYPIVADALRVQVYSDGNNDLVSIHLRGRGGVSQYVDDSAMATKATLIQYLSNSSSAAKVKEMPENKMIVYPNPAINETSVSFILPNTVETIQIFDVTGRLVRTIENGTVDYKSSVFFNVQDLQNGIYYIKSSHKNGNQFYKRLLIQH